MVKLQTNLILKLKSISIGQSEANFDEVLHSTHIYGIFKVVKYDC